VDAGDTPPASPERWSSAPGQGRFFIAKLYSHTAITFSLVDYKSQKEKNMPDAINRLYLYEALELRAEYDARIKTLKECLPEGRENRNRLSFRRDEDSMYRPSPEFNVAEVRDQLRKLEFKRRKLNSAIQQTNFQNQVQFRGDTLTLNEALEIRKGLNDRIGELHTQVVSSAYQRVVYKEDRDIVEPNELSYAVCVRNLEEARLAFRELNRKLRAVSFEIVVDFRDEE
jgi:hypothetical protein